MSVFYPSMIFPRVYNITKETLDTHGIKALILDIDNTLTTHNNPVPDDAVLNWLAEMKKAGILLILLSNNKSSRVKPFAELLGTQYVANALKPLPKGFINVINKYSLKKEETAIAGDQIFTDILGGNLYGIKTILVEPMLAERGLFFRLKRRMEVKVLEKYRKRGNRD